MDKSNNIIEKLKDATNLRNFILLALLSFQVGIQPLLMQWFARDTKNVSSRVGVIEGIKFIFALVPLYSSGNLLKEFQEWKLSIALKTTVAPSLIYIIQNYLNQTAVVILDGVTFNILNQTKIIWTAILVYVILGRKQSHMQIISLILLMVSAIIMTTGPIIYHLYISPIEQMDESFDGKNDSNINDNYDKNNEILLFTGICQAIFAAMLSGLAGTIVQGALQAQHRNPYMVTIELSLFGIFGLFCSSFVSGDAADLINGGFWYGWNLFTFIAMISQAIGGILVGFVIKYSGNVEKSFAVVAGLMLTAYLESIYNEKPFGAHGGLALCMVAFSTYIYTIYPYKYRKKTETGFHLNVSSSCFNKSNFVEKVADHTICSKSSPTVQHLISPKIKF